MTVQQGEAVAAHQIHQRTEDISTQVILRVLDLTGAVKKVVTLHSRADPDGRCYECGKAVPCPSLQATATVLNP